MPVTRRFVGVVGGVRSRAADAGEAGKSTTSTRITATSARSLEKNRIFILFTPFRKLDELPIRLYGRGSSLDVSKRAEVGHAWSDTCAARRAYPAMPLL